MQKKGNKKVSILEMELSSNVQIDMALMDDIKKLISNYKSLDDAIKNQRSKSQTGLISYFDSIRTAYQNSSNAIDLIDQLDKKSKELGIADAGLGGYKKELAAKVSQYKTMIGKVDGIIKSL
jgi:hypothetical protein